MYRITTTNDMFGLFLHTFFQGVVVSSSGIFFSFLVYDNSAHHCFQAYGLVCGLMITKIGLMCECVISCLFFFVEQTKLID